MTKLYELIEQGIPFVMDSPDTYLRSSFSLKALMKPWCGCALGTAYVAIQRVLGVEPMDDALASNIYKVIQEHAPHVANLVRSPCGCLVTKPLELIAVVDHLHRDHCWSREQIINWLRPIEDEIEQAQLEFEQDKIVEEKVAELVLA